MSLLFKIQIVLTFSLCILITGYAQKAEDILMKVGSTDVTVGEFRYIYEKNNGANANYSEASINEYLDLYTKFKLKVEKAKQIKLDTIEALKVELDGYRMQLAGSYLIDKEVTEFLLKELYERMKYDVEFSHIFVPVAENAPNQTKQDAMQKLKDIKNKISSGTLTFENAVSTWSDDRATAANGGIRCNTYKNRISSCKSNKQKAISGFDRSGPYTYRNPRSGKSRKYLQSIEEWK